MCEPDAWSMPSPRAQPLVPVAAEACTLPEDRFKKSPHLRSVKGVKWEHEMKTVQAEITAFSEMMACRMSCERSEYSSLHNKVNTLSGSIDSVRLNSLAPVVATDSTCEKLYHTHHSAFCGLCGVWYTAGETHTCTMMNMDGDLDDPLSSSMQNAITENDRMNEQLVEEQVCILTSRRHEKEKSKDQKAPKSVTQKDIPISRPRGHEIRNVDNELTELLVDMSLLEGQVGRLGM